MPRAWGSRLGLLWCWMATDDFKALLYVHRARWHHWLDRPFIDRAFHYLSMSPALELIRTTQPKRPMATGAKPPGVAMRRLLLRPLFLTAENEELAERRGTGDDNGLVVGTFDQFSTGSCK
jgi:hypothetical protein